jgi:hypothetical protein
VVPKGGDSSRVDGKWWPRTVGGKATTSWRLDESHIDAEREEASYEREES